MSKRKLILPENKKPSPHSKGRRIRAALCLAAGIAGLIVFIQFFARSANLRSVVRLDQPIPSLMVEDSGVPKDLKKHIKGKRCVLVFYSPSCRICRDVVPYLHPIPKDLRLILINESSNQEQALTTQFPGADRFQDPHRVLTQSFATLSLPSILFVDENGILRDGLAGRHQRNFIQQKLKDFAARSFGKTNKTL
jgi:hypothetical protein